MNTYTLKDLVTIKNGRDHKHLADGKFPVYGSGGIMRYAESYLYDKPSILLPRKGTLDNIQFCEVPFWTVDTSYYTKVNETLCNPYYLYCYLNLLDLSKLNTGTGVPSMTFDSYYNIKIHLPSKSIQDKIASFLSTLDRKISLNRSINAELERMAKEVYDYWFVQFDFPDEHGRPYKSSGGAMVYNPVLKREVPEGWEDCTLGEYAKMYQPKTLSSEDVSLPDGYRVYGANGRIGYYTQYNHKDSEIAMACRGNSCGVLNRTLPFSWITGNAMVIKPHNEDTGNEYLFHAISYMNIEGAITGSGQPQLTRENLSKVKMLLPPVLLIDKFNNIISSNLQQRICLEEEKDKLTKLRDELLPLLMTGQVKILEQERTF